MHIVIIGNGIAGTNAARFIRKWSDYRITMISEETLQPFSRTALMYCYMGHVRQRDTQLYEEHFWSKNRIERLLDRVERVDVQGKNLHLRQNGTLHYDKLIIATGSKPNRYNWPGQDLKGVQGLYHLQDLEGMEQLSQGLQHAVVVGGGLIGIEMAEMFHSRHIPVSLLVRERSYWSNVLPAPESAMINRHIRAHGIDLHLETELKAIEGDKQGRVHSVLTQNDKRIACQFVGLTAGVSPNIDFLRNSSIELNKGVLVDEQLRSSAPDVFAIGDCAELRRPTSGRRPIEAIWYTGRMMGQTVAATICGQETLYKPGVWFNSAKFFDIEYQVYGSVPAINPTGISSLYWEHPEGKKAIRINYESESLAVTGFNLMGIRYRHEVCEKWILEGRSIEAVLQQLSLANFDPEFYPKHEQELVDLYNRLEQRNLQLQTRRSLSMVQRYLKSKV